MSEGFYDLMGTLVIVGGAVVGCVLLLVALALGLILGDG